MQKFIGIFITCFVITILVGLDNQQNLKLTDIKVEVSENILRYEAKLKTNDGSPIKNKFV